MSFVLRQVIASLVPGQVRVASAQLLLRHVRRYSGTRSSCRAHVQVEQFQGRPIVRVVGVLRLGQGGLGTYRPGSGGPRLCAGRFNSGNGRRNLRSQVRVIPMMGRPCSAAFVGVCNYVERAKTRDGGQ